MAAEQTVNHKLMVSRDSLAIMAEAIRSLTLEKERFQRLKHVVVLALETLDPHNSPLPEAFTHEPKLDGGIPINLRLTKRQNDQLDEFRSVLSKRIGDHCGVREAVIYCATQIAK